MVHAIFRLATNDYAHEATFSILSNIIYRGGPTAFSVGRKSADIGVVTISSLRLFHFGTAGTPKILFRSSPWRESTFAQAHHDVSLVIATAAIATLEGIKA